MGHDPRLLIGTVWQRHPGSAARSHGSGAAPRAATPHTGTITLAAPRNPSFVDDHDEPLRHGTRIYGQAGENPPFRGEIEAPGELASVRQGEHDFAVIHWPRGQPIKLVYVPESEPELTGASLEQALSTARPVDWHYAPMLLEVPRYHPLTVGEEGAHTWSIGVNGPQATLWESGERHVGDIGQYVEVKANIKVKAGISITAHAGHESEHTDAVDFGEHAYWNRRIGEWVFSGGAVPSFAGFTNFRITDVGIDFVHEHEENQPWRFGVQLHFKVGGTVTISTALWFVRIGGPNGVRQVSPPDIEVGGSYPAFHGTLQTPFGLAIEGELALEAALVFEPNYTNIATELARRFAAQFGTEATETAGGEVVAQFGSEAAIGGAITLAFIAGGVATVAAAIFSLEEGDEIEHAAGQVGPTADRLALGYHKGLRGEDRPENEVQGVGWDAGEQDRTTMVESLNREHPETSRADFAAAITQLADERRTDILQRMRQRFWRLAQEAVWHGFGRAHRDDMNALWEMNNAWRYIFQSEPETAEDRELRDQYPH